MSNPPAAEGKDEGQRRQRQHQMNFDLKLITTQPCGDATPSGPLADAVDESKGGPSEGWQGTRQNISEPREEQPEDGRWRDARRRGVHGARAVLPEVDDELQLVTKDDEFDELLRQLLKKF